MDPSTLPPTKELPVNFGGVVPEEEKTNINVAGDGLQAPPSSTRHLTLVDDGKLFEGHLTVQSRPLKSIIQYLVDCQAEQSLVVQDLQDQVHHLKTKLLKVNRGRGVLGRGVAHGSPMEQEDTGRRLKALEDFVLLWGVRPEDVAQLVESFGNPVVPQEEYQAYLLDLPAFRLLRQETHQLVASGGERPTITPERVAADNDTVSRRGRLHQTEDAPQTTPEEASEAMQVAVEALRRVEELQAQMDNNSNKPPLISLNNNNNNANQSKGGDGVDEVARQGVEELADYVEQRFQELSRNTSNTTNNNNTNINLQRPPMRPDNNNNNNNNNNREVIDTVAREDAAASLEMIEEMERLMERRFKEMATSIANVALRRGTPDSVAAPVVEEAASPMKVERSPRHVVPSPSPSDGTRGDLIMIADRVEDIENDFNRRWQTLEERLRIIGRATVNRPGVAPSNAPAIDRKAREDSSMSLMRVQKLERDIAALKRQLSEANARGGNDGRVPEWPEATEEKGSPHYGGEEYGSKVKSLEQDVERRMAEVNRTIAMLRGEHAGVNLNYANLLATPPRRDPSDPAPSGMSGGDIMDPPLRSSAEAASGQPTSQRVMDTTGGNELTKPSYIVLRSTEVDEEPDYDGSLQLHSARVVPSSWPSRPQPKTSRENTSRSSQFRTTHPTSEREAPSRPDSVPLEYAADAGVAVPPAAADVPQRQLDEERRKQSIRRLDEYGANITSSLGHQKPCVIANCAWCAAEREQDSVVQ